MRLYLCGPISNVPNYKKNFAEAERRLVELGYEVKNPVSLNMPDDKSFWVKAMKEAISMMFRCQGVALLDDWSYSRGAMIETRLAMDLEMPIHTLQVWEQRANING